MKKHICILVMAGLCGATFADVINTSVYGITDGSIGIGGTWGDNLDSWEGATVTANSALHPATPGAQNNWFGGGAGDVIMNDAGAATMKFFEWNTGDEWSMDKVVVSLGGDPNAPNASHRSVNYVKLFASDTGLAGSWGTAAFDVTVNPIYTDLSPNAWVLVEVDLANVTGSFFRMEVLQNNAGVRIREVDGYGSVIPEPATMGLMGLAGVAMFGARCFRRYL